MSVSLRIKYEYRLLLWKKFTRQENKFVFIYISYNNFFTQQEKQTKDVVCMCKTNNKKVKKGYVQGKFVFETNSNRLRRSVFF